MKPMRVDAGEIAPDVDELIEKANNMEEMLIKVAELADDSQMRNITGVEEARMSHYWTNQTEVEGGIESVANKGALNESISFDETANPHQTGSTLSAHQNTAGGETVKKAPPMLPGMGGDMGGGGPPGGDMGGGGPGEDDIAALLSGAGGEGGDKDPAALAREIEENAKKIQEMLGGGDDAGAEEDPLAALGGGGGAGAEGPPPV
jgi:hypothetical protein